MMWKRILICLSCLFLSIAHVVDAEETAEVIQQMTGTTWGFPGYRVEFEVSDSDIAEIIRGNQGSCSIRFNRPGDVYVRAIFFSQGKPAEKQMFLFHIIGPPVDETAVNQETFAQEVLDLVNEERRKKNLADLRLADDLSACAEVRAKEISEHYSHTRPNGDPFETVLAPGSYALAGENIAGGMISPFQVVEHWLNSADHRENILLPDFREMGVAHLFVRGSRLHHYWVQLFRK